ncbi:hypothetical protein [Burkholderia gladioli]|jgi:hypothetical protein|uniref:hypothetical protein n=1 Tax=Burkholderia gladioli TaxID=28095 RepID=UPI00163F69FA|nr:hypothetical protein [Burkholderia gladioli]
MQQNPRLSPLADLIADSSPCLPGSRLIHLFQIVSPASQDAVARVSSFLSEQGAPLGEPRVSRCRELLTQTIVLDGIGERSARLLREQLLALDGVLRIRLEHRFVRADAGDDAADYDDCRPACTAA